VLGAQIGIGGMSEVYHATDTVEVRTAAVKLLSPAFAGDSRAREMARREAWVIAQVRHPTVPVLYDHGEALLGEGVVVPCTVMELISGVMLTDLLARGPLPWREAVRFTATIGDALAVAHRRGIVHRDLTSGNLMMTANGIKIIDFGLAGTVARDDQGDPGVFRSQASSPRTAQRPVTADWDGTVLSDAASHGDPADDVYSLGVLLYQMLTGRSPYSPVGESDHPAAARQRRAAPTPVLIIPGMPRVVADICRDCMAKRSTDRPDSVGAALALWSVLV
jgi:serine/threonine-protein kinase